MLDTCPPHNLIPGIQSRASTGRTAQIQSKDAGRHDAAILHRTHKTLAVLQWECWGLGWIPRAKVVLTDKSNSRELHHACDDRDGLLDAQWQRLVEILLPFLGVLQQLRNGHRRRVGIRR